MRIEIVKIMENDSLFNFERDERSVLDNIEQQYDSEDDLFYSDREENIVLDSIEQQNNSEDDFSLDGDNAYDDNITVQQDNEEDIIESDSDDESRQPLRLRRLVLQVIDVL